ncbi:hypothetical protein LTR27_010712 [Elasticomyces elasticus]|nr:hypothetical protein LTR27_010712 [Elasticomyces elasticus]
MDHMSRDSGGDELERLLEQASSSFRYQYEVEDEELEQLRRSRIQEQRNNAAIEQHEQQQQQQQQEGEHIDTDFNEPYRPGAPAKGRFGLGVPEALKPYIAGDDVNTIDDTTMPDAEPEPKQKAKASRKSRSASPEKQIIPQKRESPVKGSGRSSKRQSGDKLVFVEPTIDPTAKQDLEDVTSTNTAVSFNMIRLCFNRVQSDVPARYVQRLRDSWETYEAKTEDFRR